MPGAAAGPSRKCRSPGGHNREEPLVQPPACVHRRKHDEPQKRNDDWSGTCQSPCSRPAGRQRHGSTITPSGKRRGRPTPSPQIGDSRAPQICMPSCHNRQKTHHIHQPAPPGVHSSHAILNFAGHGGWCGCVVAGSCWPEARSLAGDRPSQARSAGIGFRAVVSSYAPRGKAGPERGCSWRMC